MKKDISIKYKHIVSLLLALLLPLTFFAGCSDKKSNQDLFAFDYGCTIEEAVKWLGVSEDDFLGENVDDSAGQTTYSYQAPEWISNQATIILVDSDNFPLGDKKYAIGITKIQLNFETREALDEFVQKNVTENSSAYRQGKRYVYGDWAQYQDSPNLPLVQRLLAENAAFDAEKWNILVPLVQFSKLDFLTKSNVCVFSGLSKAIAEYDEPMELPQ